jgi:hypothetical protein
MVSRVIIELTQSSWAGAGTELGNNTTSSPAGAGAGTWACQKVAVKWSTCSETWNKQIKYFFNYDPLPAQPATKTTDRQVPLAQQKNWLYTKYVSLPKH